MRPRHRMPTLFTLSMMDVFCCALGCVILLWLWNERLAKEKARSAGETRTLLEQARGELTAARSRLQALEADLAAAKSEAATLAGDLNSTRADLTAARGRVATLTTDRDRLQSELNSSSSQLAARTADLKNMQARVDSTTADLKNLRSRVDTTADLLAKKQADLDRLSNQLALRQKEHDAAATAWAEELAKKRREQDALASSLAAAQKRALDLETLTRDKEQRLALSTRRVDDLTDRLTDAEARLKSMKSTADVVPTLRSDLDVEKMKRAAAETRVRDLERDLTTRRTAMMDVQGQVTELQNDKKRLTDQVEKFRAAADNRFAGIHLTGRRVVLLVDMSGSMKSTEENIPAPEKWPAVADAASKVLKSLPDLEKFQVILFSEEIQYPLGSPGEWLDYEAGSSADRLRGAILKFLPRGNTNMHLGFDSAFAFRAKGMDTLYLLSDGLPNIGPGLTAADQMKNLKETERAEILGKHVRTELRARWNRFESGRERVKINAIGFFYESPDVGAFLWALARENDGSFVGMSKP